MLGPVASGQSTDDTTPTLNGTAAANATITIYENGQQVGTAVADANGVWSFTTGTLANGSHTDRHGNRCRGQRQSCLTRLYAGCGYDCACRAGYHPGD